MAGNNVSPKSLKVPLNWLSTLISRVERLSALEGFHNATAGLWNQQFGFGNWDPAFLCPSMKIEPPSALIKVSACAQCNLCNAKTELVLQPISNICKGQSLGPALPLLSKRVRLLYNDELTNILSTFSKKDRFKLMYRWWSRMQRQAAGLGGICSHRLQITSLYHALHTVCWFFATLSHTLGVEEDICFRRMYWLLHNAAETIQL